MKRITNAFTFPIVMCLTIFMAIISGCTKDDDQSNGEKIAPLWEAGSIRNKIVTISDLHVGIDDRYSETVRNRPLLIDFLKRLQKTKDVRELVIIGDFLDSWYLPVFYPTYTDEELFYKGVIANNQKLIDEFKQVINSGIKLVYVIGNHDMTLEQKTLQDAIPGIVQPSQGARGLATYYTGDRKEIAIEHGHRYDVFSAPDRVSNKELCGNDNTILPAGYFYARYAATWVVEGKPTVEKKYPLVNKVPDKDDIDQSGAYAYYSLLAKVSKRFTPKEGLNEKIFKMHIAGFNDDYSYLDFYPQEQPDGTISGKLFKNIQRTWGTRQEQNKVKKPNTFLSAISGTINWDYYFEQARVQYLENSNENVNVVVFGHTHVPTLKKLTNGKYYVNDGTWVDDNTDYPEATRTFAVITTGDKNTVGLYMYEKNGNITNIGSGAK
ncbi:metallophosphoesterase [Porphyromonas pogonae]|uniref:metallophosphoesterase n=1 Tax=Porphyromonas pogonae TaxID=867595 RepID=UPI002E7A6736|nr:metallophosphoesterase [Porphyromonas pogonae]